MKKFIDKLILTVLIIIMLVSGFKIVTYFYQAHKQKEIIKSVEQKISENENEKGTTKIDGKKSRKNIPNYIRKIMILPVG